MKTQHHIVLVTGGGSGIGYALAQKFHSAGNRVILVGRTKAALLEATRIMAGVEYCVADVASAQDRQRLVEQFSDVTILVNNAGIQVNRPVGESAPEEIEHEVQVNFLAPVLLTRAFLPLLATRPEAAVINVTSGLALVPKETAAMYCASKAALHSFSKTLRWQLEGGNVRVFEVLPPLVETAMTAGRGKGKISTSQLAEEFWDGFRNNRFEMLIGKTKLLKFINRVAPGLAEKIMRRGL